MKKKRSKTSSPVKAKVKKTKAKPKLKTKTPPPQKIDLKELEWTHKISVGDKKLDQQHKKMLEQISHLIQKIYNKGDARQTMQFLNKYIKGHLADEEKYMQKHQYPKLKQHKSVHKNFINFMNNYEKDFKKSFSSKDLTQKDLDKLANKAKKFLGLWWVNHISKSDKGYSEYIKKSKKISKNKSEKHHKKHKHKPEVTHIKTGVPGFDELFTKGIPKGSAVIVAGGAGSGKTIFCLQTLAHHAKHGHKCFYMSFEESNERLKKHMKDFGWDADKMIKSGKLKIARYSPFDVARNVDAMLAKEKGELLIDLNPVILPKNFKPNIIVLDSLTAVASAFTGKEDSYRIYIEQLFRFFEKMGTTSLLITETTQVPEIFSTTGVEEFLADGVIVLYNFKRGDIRENAIEILKMRGEKHRKNIVAMQISGNGITVYPEQETFESFNQ